MCGISGAIGFIDDSIQSAVELMNDAQIHRGPDDQGFWSSVNRGYISEKGIVLAHRRLSILDLSEAGNQPMKDMVSGSMLVYNGEIYNYRDLRYDMEKHDNSFSSDCDTEVLLKLLVTEGIESLTKCNGMFGFAFWDEKKKSLTLGRDRLGIKPLYYSVVEQRSGKKTLLFASELRALLASNLINRYLDSNALDTYLWNGYVTGNSTIVAGVSLLPAGTTLLISADKLECEPEVYWNLPKNSEKASSIQEVRDAFNTAVSQRLVSDVPIGIFLSGGIDSSAVAACATHVSKDSIYTFNVGFPEVEYDESIYAKEVAMKLGTLHQTINLTESDFESNLDCALKSIDQPTFDGINSFYVSKAVREAGVTVALAGTGGDELFGGYSSFVDLPNVTKIAQYLRLLPDHILSKAAMKLIRMKVGPFGVIPPQTRWGKLSDILMARGSLVETYQVSYAIYTQSFLKQLRPNHSSLPYGLPVSYLSKLQSIISGEKIERAISLLELSGFVGQRLLRDTDAASMAVSLEVRVPLLDHNFIESVFNLNSDRRFKPFGKKQALRDIGLSELPPEMFNRPKTGFVLPFENWLRRGLGNTVKETLHDTQLCERIGLNPEAVVKIWQAFEEKAPGMYWSRVWLLFVLLYWCREHDMILH